MSKLFEAFVDILEYEGSAKADRHMYTERYEIDANTKYAAGREALHRAEVVHPAAAELDVRITRIIH